MNFEQSFISMSSETQVLHAFADMDGDGGIVGSGISVARPTNAMPIEFAFPIVAARAADMTGDGIDDLVVNNAEGAYALLSN